MEGTPSDDQFSSTNQGQSPLPPRKQLQGPRPTPLKVRKDSHKIKKPPFAPQQQQPQPPRPPVIIYTVSPKVIHSSPAEFMALVQRLTGSDSPATATDGSDGSGGGGGDVVDSTSPEARYASIEKTKVSPQNNKKLLQQASCIGNLDDHGRIMIDLDEAVAHEMGGGSSQVAGVGLLSPVPSSLPAIPPELFSSSADPKAFFTTSTSSFSNLVSSPNVLQVQQHGASSRTTGAGYMVSPSAAQHHQNFLSPGGFIFSPATLDILRNFLD